MPGRPPLKNGDNMNEDSELDREFDFSNARSNPYAKRLREADEIRITVHKEDGTKEVRTYESMEEMAVHSRQVQLEPEQYGKLMRIATRKGISHEELVRKWIDDALEREEVEEKTG